VVVLVGRGRDIPPATGITECDAAIVDQEFAAEESRLHARQGQGGCLAVSRLAELARAMTLALVRERQLPRRYVNGMGD